MHGLRERLSAAAETLRFLSARVHIDCEHIRKPAACENSGHDFTWDSQLPGNTSAVGNILLAGLFTMCVFIHCEDAQGFDYAQIKMKPLCLAFQCVCVVQALFSYSSVE